MVTAATTPPARDVLADAGYRAGVRTDGAKLIRDGSNVLYALPGEVVARIGRVGAESTARREVEVSLWLAANGFPAVRAIAGIDQPTLVKGWPVTWWALLPEHRPATTAELGATLRDLHALAVPKDLLLPQVDPFARLAQKIDEARTISTENRAWLSRHLDDLREAYTDLPSGQPLCVVHGDAWQGNLAVPHGGGPVLLDLEHVGIGRPEWDLVPLVVDHTDFGRITAEEYRAFVGAYGGYDVIAWPGFRTLAAILELRWACFVLSKADKNEEAEREARHRIACLRGDVPLPWSWSAF